MKRILATIALCLSLTSPAFAAHTGTWLMGGGWEGFGTGTVNGGSGDFLYPYMFSYPNCFAINKANKLPWNTRGVYPFLTNGQDYYITATNAATCAGGGAPNPGQGIYINLNQPHRGLDVIVWIRLNGNITTQTFILRLNDCTHAPTTGVYRGCIDNSAPNLNTSNQIQSDIAGTTGTSAALTLGTWYQFEYCYVSGVAASGTIPPDEKAWLDGTQFLTFGGGSSRVSGGGNGITFDYELGSGGSMDFGPWAVYDPGTSCPATALAKPMYHTATYPVQNRQVQLSNTGGPNWNNLDNAPPNTSKYNSSATVGQKDIVGLKLGTFGGSILGVTNQIHVESTGAGVRTAIPLYNNGTTTSLCAPANGFSLGGDTNAAIGVAAGLQNGTYQSVMCSTSVDPFTSGTWTAADLQALGVQVNN